jgi:hypothetical protein
MSDDSEIPDFIAILGRGSLDGDKLSLAAMQAEFAVRIPALLDSYGAENSMDGWRDVALQLAIAYHPAFKVTKEQRLPVSGRPIETGPWFNRQSVLARKRKLQSQDPAKTRIDAKAAREVHNDLSRNEAMARTRARDQGVDTSAISKTPSVKTLQNSLASKVPFPESLGASDFIFDVFHSARRAALKIPPVK